MCAARRHGTALIGMGRRPALGAGATALGWSTAAGCTACTRCSGSTRSSKTTEGPRNGLTASVARTCTECSRHDRRAHGPSARPGFGFSAAQSAPPTTMTVVLPDQTLRIGTILRVVLRAFPAWSLAGQVRVRQHPPLRAATVTLASSAPSPLPPARARERRRCAARSRQRRRCGTARRMTCPMCPKMRARVLPRAPSESGTRPSPGGDAPIWRGERILRCRRGRGRAHRLREALRLETVSSDGGSSGRVFSWG